MPARTRAETTERIASTNGIDALPTDVSIDIFYGFLHGSLMKLRLVSKHWNELILRAIAVRGSLLIQGIYLYLFLNKSALTKCYHGPITLKYDYGLDNCLIDALKNDVRLTGLLFQNMRGQFGAFLSTALQASARLKSLKLKNIYGGHVFGLAEGLATNTTLSYLELSNCELSTECSVALYEAVASLPKLTELDLNYNRTGGCSRLLIINNNEEHPYEKYLVPAYKALSDALISNATITRLKY